MKISLLRKIENEIKQYAQVIASVLKVDVDIADNHLFRIAGTGRFTNTVGTYIEKEGTAFKWVLENKKIIVIENPRYHQICDNCPSKATCREVFEICCPIKLDKEVIGVIALACFQKEQKKFIFKDLDNYVKFLKKIAELISSKVGEYKNFKESYVTSQMLKRVMGFVSQGVMIFNQDNTIKYINGYAENILGNNKNQLEYLYKIKEFKVNVIQKKRSNDEKEFIIQIRNKKIHLLGYMFRINIDEDNYGKVFVFQDISTIQKSFLINDNKKYNFDSILGKDEKLLKVKDQSRVFAKTNHHILICGESGTGKERFARAIHNESIYREQPFIPVICTGIIDTILEQEIFGDLIINENDSINKMELIKEGTLYLDEVADLPIRIQGRLLQVLQEEKFNGRILASTSKDIGRLVKENRFRKDLFYLLYPFTIYIPPLRERRKDISLLINYFIEKYCYIEGKKIQIEANAFNTLENYSWMGNIRELENVISYIVTTNNNGLIEYEDLPSYIISKNDEVDNCIYNLESLEKDTIIKALNRYGNTTEGKRKVAKVLGISPATLYRKLNKYNISEEKNYVFISQIEK